MTYAELQAEVIARGYDMLQTSRVADFVQRSHRLLEARYPWPWLEETAEGTAPLEISDLRDVLSVTDETEEMMLTGQDRRWLAEVFPGLEEESAPQFWYLENQTLRVYPQMPANIISVRYVKKAPLLEAEADEPLSPVEYHYLIADLAVSYCLRDDDEYQESRELKGDVENDLRAMAMDQLKRDYQGPRLTVRTGPIGSYL